ncbi:MAG TPA: SDR family NAD(P)-dependent oxidoreductase [Aquabacterium sp.]|uniref:SDR family NAD(P)-dependent oxidoreductase n=1 Tax=Aquabacterium sp. TaxID=1872578 RepID=UPI002E35D592|nr:SDR family NAD(P)-dependent oxidoreductase [Aquabacterium sp.]HEX5355846.1 SDR family NAD(P)-dependent oxidoreductase [Aquabacterium sp.]
MALNPRIHHWTGQTVWLVGASTGIGRATAARLHELGAQVIVSARNEVALRAFVLQHPGSEAVALDVVDMASVREAHERVMALSRTGTLDMVVYCAGHYKPMRAQDFDLAEALRHQRINYDGALHVLDAVLPTLLCQGSGHISLVASVAGFRGLPKALAYGPTKAALNSMAETLYLDLHAQGIGVSVINPGFVATPMTAHNDFTMPALLTPEQAAREMVAGWEMGRFEIHFPRRFTLWLKLLRHLPHCLYFPAVRRVTGE